MFYLSRRQVHAVLFGAAAAASYLAAAEAGSKKPVKMTGLFMLGIAAMGTMTGGVLSSKTHAKAIQTENRLNGFFNNGGSVGGNFQVNGDHIVTGTTFSHLAAPSGFGNVQVANGSGLGMLGGNISMNGNNITGTGQVNGNGSQVGMSNGASMGDSLIMNNNNAFTFGHITSNQIGPGSNRSNLTGTPTNTDLRDRCNYLLQQLQGAGICY